MINIELNPIVNLETFDSINRSVGLSGFIRAKNEGEYIYQVISSWIDLLDELIVVFNDCSDNTEYEIKRAINDFGGKVKAFKYLPKVFAQGSKEHVELPHDNVHSLVHYYNYALSKTTCKYAVKIDGDIIYDTSATDIIRSYLANSSETDYFKLHGVNLIDNHGELFIPSNSIFCGMNGDLCIFPVSKNNIFKWKKEFEFLDLSGLSDAGGVFAYYHMKFIKKDMGFSNYLLKDNPQSRYVKITKEFIIRLRFLSIERTLNKFNITLKLPNTLRIKAKRKRDFKKDYKDELWNCGIVISSRDVATYLVMKIVRNMKSRLVSVVKKITS
ncbi:hypothetical protein [Aliivibrio salmonicida]|uniref:hypothetical protein n=1 Tax=Aliivibrio salmonicida TaxID=40269 RepID=UPI003097CC16